MVRSQSWRQLLRRWLSATSRRTESTRNERRPLVLELLEDRIVPANGPNAINATTNVITSPADSPGATPQLQGSGPFGLFDPSDIQTAYGISSLLAAGNNGAGQTIALIDAYDDPNFVSTGSSGFSTSDEEAFSTQFGLPLMDGLSGDPTFKKVNQTGGSTPPGTDPSDPPGSDAGGWPLEESLDVEWAHAIAPFANIILVEANSGSTSNLYAAADWAAKSVANSGGGASVVSMSFGIDGGSSNETSADAHFSAATYPHVTFVAAAGDDGSVNSSGKDATNGQADYPADSSNVVAVGGTSLTIAGNGNPIYSSESVWNDGPNGSFYEATGGGLSKYESAPSYQQGLVIHNGSSVISANGMRAAPDVAFLADPDTGVYVIDSYDDYDYGVGGTSLSTPAWAGLFAITDQIRANHGLTPLSGATQTLPTLYQMATNASVYANDFHDVTSGNNNNSNNTAGFAAGPGYDLVTGLGTPIANNLLPDLAGAVVTNVSSTAANGTYGATATIPITITFDTSVTVTGTPQLTLNSGGTANYSSGSGSTTLTFTYVVAAGQNSSHLDFSNIGSLTLNGGTISVAGSSPVEAADLSLMPLTATGSLGENKDIVINTTPTVTAVSPTGGPTAGGTTVTITGTNFTPASTVNFGSVPGTGVVFVSLTTLTAVSPPEPAGAVDVIVTTAGGTSAANPNDQFTFVAAPTVTAVAPTSGPSTGGTTVTITGTGFTAASTVNFGNTAATSVTFITATQLTAVDPAGTGVVDVTVATPLGGTSATSSADQFTYDAATNTNVTSTPASPITQGTSITFTATITGSPSVGTVTFYGGPGLTNEIGSPVNVSNGSATSAADTTLPVGTDIITAVYSGGTGFSGSQGTESVLVNPSLIATTTLLIDDGPNPSLFGVAVNFMVSVTPASGSAISGETVNIEDASNGDAVVATPIITNGTASFTLSSLSVGTHNLFAAYPGDSTEAASQSSQVTQTILSNFEVVSSVATPNGVVITFDAPVDETTTHLYNSAGGTLGAPDVTVVGTSTGPVEGSLVLDPTNPYIATFVKTSGLLATDNYGVTVTTAVQAIGGASLTGNYNNTLTVSAPSTPVLSVPGFSRGAGQTVNVPNTASGLPVSLTNATNVTQASFTLTYDPTLLTIAATGAVTPSSAATSVGLTTVNYTITSVDAHHSILTVSITGGTGLTAGTTPVALVDIAATVPVTAPYFDKAVLNLGNVQVNSTPASGVSGVDEAAYFGDVLGDGPINAQDAFLVLQVAGGSGTGFSPYKDLDPTLIADIMGHGSLLAQDAFLLLQAAGGSVVPQLPAIPSGTATITAATWASGTASITVSAAPALAYTVGQNVSISGVTPSGYDGTFVITSVVSSISFTYALATNPGTATAFGTAVNVVPTSGPDAGADPVLYFEDIQGEAGGIYTVRLDFKNTSSMSLALSSLDEAVLFDPSRFTVSNVLTGSLLTSNGANDWSTIANIDNTNGTIRIGQVTASPTMIAAGASGTLLTFQITVSSHLTPGTIVPLNLAGSVTSNGSTTTTDANADNGPLTLNPAPTNGSNDAGVDGTLTIVAPISPPGTVANPPASVTTIVSTPPVNQQPGTLTLESVPTNAAPAGGVATLELASAVPILVGSVSAGTAATGNSSEGQLPPSSNTSETAGAVGGTSPRLSTTPNDAFWHLFGASKDHSAAAQEASSLDVPNAWSLDLNEAGNSYVDSDLFERKDGTNHLAS